MRVGDRPKSSNARWIALVVVCLAQLMSVVDTTIVNVALPSIQRSLSFRQADLTWVLNGYMITFGSFLLLAGRLGDLIGRRRTFLAGVAFFTAASATCGIADSQTLLIVARFAAGLGAAGATAPIMAIISVEFQLARERAKAMSIYVLVLSSGGALGLLVGGVITQLLNWHWIFFINVPVGIATFLLARRWVTENATRGIARNFDVGGPVLVTAAMILGIYALVTSSTYGWGSVHTLALGAGAMALLAGFVGLEAHLADPIMPLRIFRVGGLLSSSLIRALLRTGLYATFFIGLLYLQQVRHYGVLRAGLAYMPQTLSMAALSVRTTPWLLGRFGAPRLVVVGVSSCAAGLALALGFGAHTSYLEVVLPSFVLVGVGVGLAMTPLLTISMADVPAADAGLASGIVNTSNQLGGAIGVAVLGTVAAERTRALLAGGASRSVALVGGYHLAFLVALGCGAAAVLASIIALRDRPAVSATAQAGLVAEVDAA